MNKRVREKSETIDEPDLNESRETETWQKIGHVSTYQGPQN